MTHFIRLLEWWLFLYPHATTTTTTVSPRAYLPVQLIEGRVAKDLCANLEAIRDFVATAEED
jgi:hypothetical protein